MHRAEVAEGEVKAGAVAQLDVAHSRRAKIRANHSATHLLHEALREVLGTHVAQKGSLVAPERLRFDVSHPKPMTAEELSEVETMANEIILQNSPVTTRIMAPDDARAMRGARRCSARNTATRCAWCPMGTLTETRPNGTYSVELCGGTHVRRDRRDRHVRGSCRDSAASAGVRRIEALTGEGVRAST